MRTRQKRVATDTWRSLGCRTTPLEHWSKRKPKAYKAEVLPTLLYACETWTVYQRHDKRSSNFHLSCLRKLLKSNWQEKISDREALKRAVMQSIHTLLKLVQLRWTGHVTIMPDERLPKTVFYRELQVGKRSNSSQQKRYKDAFQAKPPLRYSICHKSRGNSLHRIE